MGPTASATVTVGQVAVLVVVVPVPVPVVDEVVPVELDVELLLVVEELVVDVVLEELVDDVPPHPVSASNEESIRIVRCARDSRLCQTFCDRERAGGFISRKPHLGSWPERCLPISFRGLRLI
jgi:hypothetical protein